MVDRSKQLEEAVDAAEAPASQPPAPPPAPADAPPVETSDASPRRVGGLIILLVFGGFGLWSLLAPLDSAALAPGVVAVEGHRKTVQHFEGGIVRRILVREGERVEEGEPLVELDATQARAELGIVMGQFYSVRALADRLAAERADAASIEFSPKLDVDDERASEAILNERSIFEARREERRGKVNVLELQIEQLQAQIEGLEALVASKRSVAKLLDEEIDDLSALLDEGYVDKQRLRELQRSRSSLLGDIADHESSIAASRVRIGESRQEILQLERTFITEVADQIAEAQAQLFEIGQRRLALEDRNRRVVLRAPVAGIAFGMSTHTIGGVVKPGDTLLEIVPEDDELIINARVAPADIDRVEVGTEAEIRFSAFKNTYTVTGTLTKVSADRLIDKESGMPYYAADVVIDRDELVQRLGEGELLPGMPAEVLIKTGERTLFQYLVTPASNMLARSMIED